MNVEDKKVLKEAIKERGVTQREVAEVLGIGTSGLSMNMTRDKMGLDNFRKILDALEYDVVIVDRKSGKKMWTVDS